jgi:hypothetical protein
MAKSFSGNSLRPVRGHKTGPSVGNSRGLAGRGYLGFGGPERSGAEGAPRRIGVLLPFPRGAPARLGPVSGRGSRVYHKP